MFHWTDLLLLLSVIIQLWGFSWLIWYQNDPTEVDWIRWRNSFEKRLRDEKYKKKHGIDTGDCWSPQELEKIKGIYWIEMNLIRKPVEGIPTVIKIKLPILFYRYWYGKENALFHL